MGHDDCSNCPDGKFNNITNGRCRPWTNCTESDMIVATKGSKTTDNVCAPLVRSTISPTRAIIPDGGFHGKLALSIALIAVAALFLLCIVMTIGIIIALSKRKKKPKDMEPVGPFKPILLPEEEEDACSYHLPEEEQSSRTDSQTPLHKPESV
nr:PREDICTED: tumor necrosis factor receptor superfamily member 9 [Latimeria chalumnae]|eukprot:XP_014342825.1 PREDICTED: tumor necrosis factor receptor superfamily member 9 [Latimeria chalumnae]